MNQGDEHDWGFPEREVHIDCAGERVEFRLEVHETPTGWSVEAIEVTRAAIGYRFEAFSPISPFMALGRLREKIREGLATKYLAAERELQLRTKLARGHIAWDRQEDGVVLVIDGRRVTFAEFATLLGSYEGWEFELRVKDSSE